MTLTAGPGRAHTLIGGCPARYQPEAMAITPGGMKAWMVSSSTVSRTPVTVGSPPSAAAVRGRAGH